MSDPTVSVNVPCYQQLPHARRAVRSLLEQSWPAVEITLFDDGSSDEYRAYVEALGESRVRYCRNRERLGAMGNMLGAITQGSGPYSLAFHEDDLLGRDYLRVAVAILESHPRCAFVACELHEFKDDPPADETSRRHPHPAYELFPSSAALVRGILRGVNPMFGSVVYRRSALSGIEPRRDRYGTLVDRPFLLSILQHGWSGAVISEPLVWYRHHGEGDTRHQDMTTDHILNLLRTYRGELPAAWSKSDRALFLSFSGYWLPELYRLTPPANRTPVRQFLFKAWREGLYTPRARGRLGLRQIGRALAGRLP
jgi:glycosyltransferase involved in cell wall biosynthesis